jgi:type II secretory pathway predicted ATPase ExeA
MLDVYKTRYHLNDNPFRLGPNHRFSYAHQSYANARAYLDYGISQGEGFVVVTGCPGTGKTTLINQLLAELDANRVAVASLNTAQLDSGNLLRIVVQAFDLKRGGESGPLQALEQFLHRQGQRNRRTVLIVDEAQGLSASSLEELRLLTNIQSGGHLLLQIFLVGQEGLLEIIRAPAMEHLQQRLVAAARLEPLDLDETIGYVEHRLCRAGWRGDPTISEGALRLIHGLSGGIPRRINLLCHRLFLAGGLQDNHELGADDVRQVIEELSREGLLSAEAEANEGVLDDQESTAQSEDGPTLVRSLPRPQSFVAADLPSDDGMADDPGVSANGSTVELRSASLESAHLGDTARGQQNSRKDPTNLAEGDVSMAETADRGVSDADDLSPEGAPAVRPAKRKLLWGAAIGALTLLTIIQMGLIDLSGGFPHSLAGDGRGDNHRTVALEPGK